MKAKKMSKKSEILKTILLRIASITGDVISRNEAIKEGKNSYITFDYNAFYGGYNLVRISVDNGSYSDVIPGISCCGARLTFNNFVREMRVLLIGLSYSQSNNN